MRHRLVSKIKQLVHLVAKVASTHIYDEELDTFFVFRKSYIVGSRAGKDFVWNLALFALLIPPIKLSSSSSQDQVILLKFFKLVVHHFSFNWTGVRWVSTRKQQCKRKFSYA